MHCLQAIFEERVIDAPVRPSGVDGKSESATGRIERVWPNASAQHLINSANGRRVAVAANNRGNLWMSELANQRLCLANPYGVCIRQCGREMRNVTVPSGEIRHQVNCNDLNWSA